MSSQQISDCCKKVGIAVVSLMMLLILIVMITFPPVAFWFLPCIVFGLLMFVFPRPSRNERDSNIQPAGLPNYGSVTNTNLSFDPPPLYATVVMEMETPRSRVITTESTVTSHDSEDGLPTYESALIAETPMEVSEEDEENNDM